MTDLERELLDALRQLKEIAVEFASSDPDMPSHRETEAAFDSAVHAAQRVIAKAEGK
jgi:hypothetical protein